MLHMTTTTALEQHPAFDLYVALANIEADCERIRRGLADECESEVTTGVRQLAAQAAQALELVDTW